MERMRAEGIECKKSISKLGSRFGLKPYHFAIVVSILKQKLYLIKKQKIVRTYPISSSRFGVGNEDGSNKTPLGTHRVAEKIGKDARIGTILNNEQRRGSIAKINTDNTGTSEDLITTRIMRLEGLEPGLNRGKGIDSYERHIYIHGTQEEGLVGKPASHGCIRMMNKDIVELFDLVKVGTLVEIKK